MCSLSRKVYFCSVKHVLTYLIYIYVPLALLLTGVSCSDDEDAGRTPEEELPALPGQRLSRTAIIYMSGENSLATFVAEDTVEIVSGLRNIPDGTRVVIYIDDTKSSRICAGTRTERLRVAKTYDTNISSTTDEGMSRVLNDIIGLYPAEHYSITFWSHGSGWTFPTTSVKNGVRKKAWGFDNGQRRGDYDSNSGPQMDPVTMREVLQRFPRFDYLFFDACYMQCVELAYELRGVTDYVIGSPAEIPGPGAPYEELLAAMCQVPADVEGIVNTYVDYYEDGREGPSYPGAELSLIRTSALGDLAEATAPIVQRLLGDRTQATTSTVQRYCFDTKANADYFDLKNWLYNALSQQEYKAWLAVYEQAVPLTRLSPEWFSAQPTKQMRSVNDAEHCGGVSVFIPSEAYATKGWVERYHALAWYEAVGMNQTGW